MPEEERIIRVPECQAPEEERIKEEVEEKCQAPEEERIIWIQSGLGKNRRAFRGTFMSQTKKYST